MLRCASTWGAMVITGAALTAQTRPNRVDWHARFVDGPPPADHVEILQREPERIDDRMTAGTRGILPMLRKPLAYRGHWGTRIGPIRRRVRVPRSPSRTSVWIAGTPRSRATDSKQRRPKSVVH